MPDEKDSKGMGSSRRWRIGAAVFDPSQSRIERDEQVLELDQSSLLLLHRLIEQVGETVDKETLLHAGWPDRIVTENSLPKAIGRLRQALGDEQGERVRVIHGYGYCLVSAIPIEEPLKAIPPMMASPVGPESVPALSPTPSVRGTHWQTWLLFVAAASLLMGMVAFRSKATATPSPAEPTPIAVLPFADLSPNHDQRYFSDGLSDELMASLDQLPQIKVVGRNSALSYRNLGVDALTMGRALKVGTVLDGSVRKDGDHIHVTVQLLETNSGNRLWSESYDRPYKDLFTIQDEIARAVLGKLRLDFQPEQIKAMRGLRTNSPEAFERYLFGIHQTFNDETGGRRSLAAFEQAVQLDPGFYEAWVRLADTLASGFYPDDAEEALDGKRRAMLALDRAIAIAPDIPDAWLERGDWKYSLFWDWEGAVPDLEQGAKLSSKDNISYLVRMMRLRAALGHLDESIALGRHAIKLDPNSTANVVMGYHLTALGRYEEAERILTHRARVAPQDEHAHFYLGLGKPLQGNPQESLRHFEDSAHVLRLTGLAAAYHSLGDRKKSDQNLELLQQRYGHMFPANVTEVHAYRGEKDLAFKWLDRSCELHDASIMYLLWNPLLRRLHGDPRFTAILKKINLPNTPIDPATPTGTPSVRKSGP